MLTDIYNGWRKLDECICRWCGFKKWIFAAFLHHRMKSKGHFYIQFPCMPLSDEKVKEQQQITFHSTAFYYILVSPNTQTHSTQLSELQKLLISSWHVLCAFVFLNQLHSHLLACGKVPILSFLFGNSPFFIQKQEPKQKRLHNKIKTFLITNRNSLRIENEVAWKNKLVRETRSGVMSQWKSIALLKQWVKHPKWYPEVKGETDIFIMAYVACMFRCLHANFVGFQKNMHATNGALAYGYDLNKIAEKQQ